MELEGVETVWAGSGAGMSTLFKAGVQSSVYFWCLGWLLEFEICTVLGRPRQASSWGSHQKVLLKWNTEVS